MTLLSIIRLRLEAVGRHAANLYASSASRVSVKSRRALRKARLRIFRLSRFVPHRLLRWLGRRRPREDRRGRLSLFSTAVAPSQPDLLQHTAIARSLAQSIRDTPDSESLGIALYGPWGQGKSMIGTLLQRALRSEITRGEFVFTKIDAWKYTHKDDRQPLRRHFLISAYQQARLTRQARYLRTLFQTEFTGSVSRFHSPLRMQTFVTPLVAYLLLGLGLATVAYVVVDHNVFRGHPKWAAAAIALVAPTAAYLPTALNTYLRVTGRVDPFRSIEDFDEALGDLLKRARDRQQRPVRRFIFFIDDLDRCSDDLVLEAIETLQAFFGRPKCAYVVAADREQLRRAVRAQRARIEPHVAQGAPVPPDETFLEKIFHSSIDVPPPLTETIATYGSTLAEECFLATIIGAAEVAGVLDALIHSGVRSPRQARVILNEYLLAHEGAVRREAHGGTHLAHKPLTTSARLLAIVTVLRVHFPWFYEMLFDRPDLLARMYEHVEARELNTAESPEAQAAADLVREAAGAATSGGRSEVAEREEEKAREAPGGAKRLYDGLLTYLTRTGDTVPATRPTSRSSCT